MHSKTFSLINDKSLVYQLSTAYDLSVVLLIGIEGNDEVAIPFTGVVVNDSRAIVGFTGMMFVDAMMQSGISEKVAQRILHKIATHREKWCEIKMYRFSRNT